MESICKPHRRPYSLAAPEATTQVTRAPLSPDLGPSQPSEALNRSRSTLLLYVPCAPERSRSPPVTPASCGSRTRGEAEARLRPEPSHGLGRLTQLRGLFVRPGGGLRAGKTNRAKAQRFGGWLGAGRKCAVWLERETKPDP